MQVDSYQFCVRIPVLKICWVAAENNHIMKIMTNMFPNMTIMKILVRIWVNRTWAKVTNNKASQTKAMDTAISSITYSSNKNTRSRNRYVNKITRSWRTSINSISNTDNPIRQIITQISPNKNLHLNKYIHPTNNRLFHNLMWE